MSDGTIQVTEGTGKFLDTEQLTVGANTVQRERIQLAGAVAAALASILNSAPSFTDYGLVTRDVSTALESPQTSHGVASAVAAGGTAQIDSTQLSSGTTGKLMGVLVGASVPVKAEIQTVSDGVASATLATAYIQPGQSEWVTLPSKEFLTVAESVAAGLDGFRAVLTNLDTGSQAADIAVTFLWDETT